MSTKSEWKKIGSLRKSDKGDFYIKVDDGVTLSKGAVLQVQDPRKRLASLRDSGKLSEEAAEEMLAKIPEFIRYEIVLPPPKK